MWVKVGELTYVWLTAIVLLRLFGDSLYLFNNWSSICYCFPLSRFNRLVYCSWPWNSRTDFSGWVVSFWRRNRRRLIRSRSAALIYESLSSFNFILVILYYYWYLSILKLSLKSCFIMVFLSFFLLYMLFLSRALLNSGTLSILSYDQLFSILTELLLISSWRRMPWYLDEVCMCWWNENMILLIMSLNRMVSLILCTSSLSILCCKAYNVASFNSLGLTTLRFHYWNASCTSRN